MEIILFYAPVEDWSARILIKAINSLREKGTDTVYLLLQTDGGSNAAGFAIHNFIKASGIKVVAVNMGFVCSMGTVVFCAAQERISMPHARLHLHPNVWTFGNEKLGVSQIQEKVNILEKDQDLITETISSATGKSVEEVNRCILGVTRVPVNVNQRE